MYNNKLFGPESKVSIRLNYTPINIINYADFQYHDGIPTAKGIFKDFSSYMPIISKYTTLPSTFNHSNIIESKDKWLFIHYTLDGTMKAI